MSKSWDNAWWVAQFYYTRLHLTSKTEIDLFLQNGNSGKTAAIDRKVHTKIFKVLKQNKTNKRNKINSNILYKTITENTVHLLEIGILDSWSKRPATESDHFFKTIYNIAYMVDRKIMFIINVYNSVNAILKNE